MAAARSSQAEAEARTLQAARALEDRRRVADLIDQINRWDVLEQYQRKRLLRHFVSQILAYRDPAY